MTTDLEALGQVLKRAQYRNHRAMDAALQAVGVTLVQWDALRAIGRMPGASGHDLAVETFQSDQAFGTLANRLVEQGFVVRTEGRGRRIKHLLTESGRAAVDDGHRVASGVLGKLFAPLDDGQRAVLFEALQALTADASPSVPAAEHRAA